MLRYTSRALVLAAVLALGTQGIACEENGSQDVNTNKTPPPSTSQATQLTDADRAFAIQVAQVGKHEVELGKLAAERATDSDVKAFANSMVKDHSTAGEELTQITTKLGITLPTAEDTAFKDLVDRLSKMKGMDYDRAYMNEMVDGHSKAATDIGNYASSGTNPDLKAWATKTLPVVREHLKVAQDIVAKLGTASK